MSLFYVCNNPECLKTGDVPAPVRLDGVQALKGIMLPEALHHQDFCSVECFWAWTRCSIPKCRRKDDP